MKKILYVTTINLTVNTFLVPHILYLKEKGYEVDIANNLDTPISTELEQANIKHYQVDFSRNPLHFNNIKSYFQIKKILKENNYDYVHVHTPVAAFFTRLTLKKYPIKVIYTAHGFHFYKGAPFLNWILFYPLELLAARWTDIIITINNEDFERAKKFKKRKNGKVQLMNGVGINLNEFSFKMTTDMQKQYRSQWGISENDFVILVLAELNKNKNHIQLIKAIDLLSNNYQQIKVLCAGKGDLESSLKLEVKKRGITDNFRFIGFRKDINQLLNICDCVGLFSKREGLGKCLLEGMAVGKPIIATNTRGPQSLIVNGHNGYLVEVDDYIQLAYYLEQLYLNKNICEKFSMNNLKIIKNYSLEEVLNTLDTIYN